MLTLTALTVAGATLFGGTTLHDRRNRRQAKLLIDMLQDSNQPSIQRGVRERLDDLKALVTSHTVDASTAAQNEIAPALSMMVQQGQQVQKTLGASLWQLEEEYHWFIKTRVDPLFQGQRHALMKEIQIDDDEDREITPDERAMNRTLALSGLLTVAAVTTAPIGGAVAFFACVPLALYLVRHTYIRAYLSLKEEHRLTIPVLFAINQTLLWFGGFYTLGGVIFILSEAGQKLSYITEIRSRKQLVNIFGKLPRQVWVLNDGVEIEIPFDQLRVGDVLVVRAGQMIPIDGVISDGYASIDQHRLTGKRSRRKKRWVMLCWQRQLC